MHHLKDRSNAIGSIGVGLGTMCDQDIAVLDKFILRFIGMHHMGHDSWLFAS